MAVTSDTNYYSNAIVGTPQVGADINVHELHSTPKFAIGFGFERADGAKFRYCQFGAATAASRVVSVDVSESAIIASIATNTGLASNTTTAVAGEAALPGAAGSHYVEVTATPANTQTFAGGYLGVTGGTGQGYMYRIKSSSATGTPSTSRCRLQLFEPLAVAIDTTSDLSIIGSPYANLEAATFTADALVVGVTMAAPSANSFAWVQTKGLALCLQDAETAVIGQSVFLSTATAGAVAAMDLVTVVNTSTSVGLESVNSPVVGYLVDNGASAGSSVVYLTLE
jgi:hypothetical protein